jgi:hypothetical protein
MPISGVLVKHSLYDLYKAFKVFIDKPPCPVKDKDLSSSRIGLPLESAPIKAHLGVLYRPRRGVKTTGCPYEVWAPMAGSPQNPVCAPPKR